MELAIVITFIIIISIAIATVMVIAATMVVCLGIDCFVELTIIIIPGFFYIAQSIFTVLCRISHYRPY